MTIERTLLNDQNQRYVQHRVPYMCDNICHCNSNILLRTSINYF